MQQFDITVPANSPFPVHAPGRYIKYIAGSNGGGDASLIVIPGAGVGGRIVLQPGQAYRIADAKATPDSWVLQNAAGGATIVGKVVIGDGRIDDNTLQGVVSVVDGGKFRTLSNSSFAISAGAGAVASNYIIGQLWVPPASTVRAVVESIQIRADTTAISGNVTFSNAALASPIQTTNGNPKVSGGNPAQAQVKIATTTVNNQPTTQLFAFSVQAGGYQNLYDVEPLVILPGYGLNINCVVLNATMVVNYQWYEEPNV